jgi:uncharacterized repeat protein (TIGR02543 family)
MRKTFKESLKGIRKIIFTSVFIFLIGLFFIDNKKLHATHTVTFHVNSSSYEVIYNLNDTIVEIPALTGRVFEGWYDNVNYTGTNYYGAVVSAATPTDLYALTYLEYNIDDFTVEAYGAGYKLTEYTGTNDMVSIPGYYYEEAGVTGLYEVKDILCVGSATFLNNNVPVYVSIPASVTLIEAGTFNNLPNLMMIYVDEDNSNYSSELEVLYNKSKTEIIHFPAQNYVENFEIPSTVTTIKKHAFYNTAYLKKVIIDGSVTTIENEAFIGNSVLETVVVNNGSLATIGAEAFKNNGNLKIAMIPNTVTFVGSNAYGGSNASLNIYYQDPVASIPGTWDTNWNMGGYAVVGEYDLINVTVTYKDDDNSTILHTETVSFNNDATYNVTPTKASTPQYHYTFNSWTGGSLTNIVSDLTVTASYNSILRYYTVTFHDASGNVYAIESFPYGEDESNNDWYASEMYKAPDAQYTYEFSHWNPSLTNITSDVDTYPVFTETLRYYEVIFYEHDDTNVFSHDYLGYGTMINAPATNPTKSSTVQYTYTFAGWYTDVLRTIAFTPGTLTGTLNVYPKFTETLRTYKVEFYNDSVLYDEQNVVYGGDATAPATNPTKASTPQYHYTFTGWDKTFTNIQGYLRVNAVYSATLRSYTIRFYNESTLLSTQTIAYGDAAIAPANPSKAATPEYTYTFDKWSVDYSYITGALDVYALYTETPNSYNVTYNTNGGTAISPHTQAYNSKITTPTQPTKVGYTFVGWYSDSELLTAWDFLIDTMPAADLTLYVKWNINSYTISFNSNGGSSVSNITKNYNEEITLVTPTKTGHSFIGWYREAGLINQFTLTNMPAENLTLYAGWTINSYTISFNSNGGSSVLPITQVYNTAVTKPADPTKTGHTFVDWYSDESLTNVYEFGLMPAENKTLYAKWSVNSYTITFNSMGGSAVTPITANYNTAISAPTSPTMMGHSFGGWYTEATLDNLYEFTTMPAENLTLYAGWTINSYTISFNSNGGSSVLPITQVYNTAVTKPADPTKTGHTFVNWCSDEHLLVDYEFTTMPGENITLYAKWSANNYTISFNSNGGSLVSSITQAYGTTLTPPAAPTKTGHSFGGWYTEAALNNLYEFTTMPAENKTLYAKWTINSYTISFNSNGGTSVTAITENYNEAITQPADPTKTGHTFVGWYSNEDLTNAYTFPSTMPAENVTLYAKWNIISYAVHFYSTESGVTPKVVFETVYVEHGNNATVPEGAPTKASTLYFTYEFSEWSGNILNVTEEREIYPVFTEHTRTYAVRFYNESTLIVTRQVEYGEAAVAPDDPTKEPTNTLVYTFAGWDKAFDNITADLDVYATYTGSERKYEVKFYNESVLIVTRLVSYEGAATAPDDPTKAPTPALVYTFTGWDKAFNYITSDLNVYAEYSSSPREYTVNFYNDGVLHDTQEIVYEGAATAPANPSKAATPEYTYTFDRWDKAFNYITSDLDVYALYDATPNSYTITFNTNGGSLIDGETHDYGEVISAPTPPTKNGYNFSGWYKNAHLTIEFTFTTMPAENITLYAKWTLATYTITYENTEGVTNLNPTTYNINSETINLINLNDRESHLFVGFYTSLTGGTKVTQIVKGSYGNVTLYARWEIREYTVKFYNDSTLLKEETVSYGLSATAPDAPAKTGYTFTGWDKAFTNVKQNLNVYTTYQINSYTVSLSSVGTIIDSFSVNYNASITEPDDPVRTGYSFGGWYKEELLTNPFNFETELMPANNITLYAKWTINSYTISFNSNGGTSVTAITKNYNEAITQPADPTKVGHEFAGWYNDINLTIAYVFPETMPAANVTLYAKWTINTYTVKFYDEDTITFLEETTVTHGSNATYTTPTKDSTVQYEYIFAGWSESVNNVTEDLTVYATYDEVLRNYTITFYGREIEYEGINPVIQTNSLAYGTTIVAPSNPTRESTQQYDYTFSNWNQEFTTVAGDLNIYPVFTATVRSYTVTFYQDDLVTVLKTSEVTYGSGAVAPEDPTKEPTARDEFTFAGWDKDFSNITGDLDVYATYTVTIREYTVKFYVDETVIKNTQVQYGKGAVAPNNPTKASTPQYSYTFTGWDKEFNYITGNLDVYAEFEETINSYTVHFFADNRAEHYGSVTVNYGETATPPLTPTKESTAQYHYEFAGWDKDLTNVTSTFQTYATFTAVLRSYTVTFYQDDGTTVLKSETVNYGSSATAPENPTKDSTAQYDYVFSHWNLDFSFVDGNMNVYATYSEVLRQYKVSFYSEGTLYREVMTYYGNTVSLPVNPTKEPSAQYSYTFAAWYLDELLTNIYDVNTNITGELNLYAKYTEGLRSFTVSFYNEGTLYNSQTITYGSGAVAPEDPTKEPSTYYVYTFTGWDKEFNNVTSDLTVNAQYSETLRQYKVIFKVGQTTIDTVYVNAGDAATTDNPTKASTPQYHYTFTGWDKDITNVLSDMTVFAQFSETLREYMVYFYNALNVVIKESSVPYGTSAIAPDAPEKASTEEFNYVFVGWDKGFGNISSELHVYPVYNEVTRLYVVKFYNEGTLISTQDVAYGGGAVAPEDPTKPETEKYRYEFTDWDKAFDNIVSDLNVYAQFEEIIKTFRVVFYSHDGLVILSEQDIAYGSDAVAPEDPEREANPQYSYTFTGWDTDFTNITKDTDVYAEFSETLRSYTVNFYNETVLIKTETVNYGAPATAPANPTKLETEKYRYEFTGWDKAFTNIIGDLDVYAQFDEIIKTFIVTFYDDLGVSTLKVQTVPYGSSATAPANPTKTPTTTHVYTFTGWDTDFTNITEDLNVHAIFAESPRSYTVNFYNESEVISTQEVLYGGDAIAPEDPEIENTAQYSYTFTGWDKEFTNITSDLNVYAQYERTINKYEIIYYDANNEIFRKDVLEYGSPIIPPEEGPVKESDEHYNYTFTGWEGYVVGSLVEGNISYQPIYDEEAIYYNVVIVANNREYRFELQYLSPFPDVNIYMQETNKYIYIATGARNHLGEMLDELPTVVEGPMTLTIIYTAYIKVDYLTNYLNNIDFNSARSYQALKEAHEMLEQVNETTDELLALVEAKIAEYNLLVEKAKNELEIAEGYENRIFKGLLKISISLQLLGYALYLQDRRWF